ncbi:hypothetical protein [Oceanirhabdus seepicola]|uniref:Uncharacterized protein n=1 Tax=Oceanirhabdus seepicola TaxID=2828781 RepID=A0A9J6P2I3_9CLOT|nr:hypothetical protein [Oceanirhabdus seepicola]MCM1990978.1 hypothetical protein [Oceanirhabdus seepicola]
MDAYSIITNSLILVGAVCMLFLMVSNYKNRDFKGEVKYKGNTWNRFLLGISLVSISLVIFSNIIDGFDGIGSLLPMIIINLFLIISSNMRYIVGTEGILIPFEGCRYEFYEWKDVLEIKILEKRKTEFSLIDKDGKERKRTITFNKGDYKEIIGYMNQQIIC